MTGMAVPPGAGRARPGYSDGKQYPGQSANGPGYQSCFAHLPRLFRQAI